MLQLDIIPFCHMGRGGQQLSGKRRTVMIRTIQIRLALACAATVFAAAGPSRAADDKIKTPAAPTTAPPAAAQGAAATFDAVKALEGPWVGDKPMPQGMTPAVEFKVFAA